MKKVLLLGDSIRMGYDDFVKEYLPEYEVFYDPADNGRFTAYTIWQFHQLNKKYGPFNIVHFNNGYWDMHPEGPKDEPQTSIEDYVHNYEVLIREIKETGAIPVFATILPLLPKEELGVHQAEINYYNDSVIKYNDAAKKLMKKENVFVNDLYTLVKQVPGFYKCEDKLHLTLEGYKACAKQVANVIREVIKIN